MAGDKDLPSGFEYVDVLGSGAFGEVVLARHSSIDRLVAIKRIHRFVLSDDQALVRFRREAQVLAAIRHPAVVRVYDFKRTQSGAALIMEYVRGDSLSDLIKAGPLPATQCLPILRDVADALAAVAAAGVAHRDVKPGNVFVLLDGHAKLGDFGLARVVSDPSIFRTTGGQASGTPAYFAPEVSQGLGEPDERADAYSFAVMAYEVLTGRQPFVADGALATVAAHWHQQARPPHEFVPGFPPAASAALLRGLDRVPDGRLLPVPLADALSAIPAAEWPDVAARAGAALPASAVTATTRHVPVTQSVAAVATVPQRRPRRRTKLLIGTVGTAAALAAALVAVLRSGHDSAPALAVRSVSVTASPKGSCPSAVYAFVAVIRTNGSGGTLDVQWTRPDGRVTGVQRLSSRSGQTRVDAGLRFTVTGTRALRGPAVVHVVSSTTVDATSASIDYRC